MINATIYTLMEWLHLDIKENTHVKLVGFLFIIDHLNTFKNKKGFIKILVYSSVTGIIIGFM